MSPLVSTEERQHETSDQPLLSVRSLGKMYGSRIGCAGIDFDVWPG